MIALFCVAACGLLGCGSAEEAQEALKPAPRPPVREEPAHVEFQSKTDTVDVTQTGRADNFKAPGREPSIRFMVQIGAYKDPRLAAAVQTLARERYHMPVLNDFFLKAGLYQIRIGFFETRGAAMEFRARMLKEYQEDYRDAWVVQLRR
jgi:hypothetical protein